MHPTKTGLIKFKGSSLGPAAVLYCCACLCLRRVARALPSRGRFNVYGSFEHESHESYLRVEINGAAGSPCTLTTPLLLPFIARTSMFGSFFPPQFHLRVTIPTTCTCDPTSAGASRPRDPHMFAINARALRIALFQLQPFIVLSFDPPCVLTLEGSCARGSLKSFRSSHKSKPLILIIYVQ